jgi:hypothetical protein
MAERVRARVAALQRSEITAELAKSVGTYIGSVGSSNELARLSHGQRVLRYEGMAFANRQRRPIGWANQARRHRPYDPTGRCRIRIAGSSCGLHILRGRLRASSEVASAVARESERLDRATDPRQERTLGGAV